jgi:hypothetical protein
MMARIIRGLTFGLCVVAMQATGGIAQTAVSMTDGPPVDNPVRIDGIKVPNKIPEIIRPPGRDIGQIHSKATLDPVSVLKPPAVDPRIFAARQGVFGDSRVVDPE